MKIVKVCVLVSAVVLSTLIIQNSGGVKTNVLRVWTLLCPPPAVAVPCVPQDESEVVAEIVSLIRHLQSIRQEATQAEADARKHEQMRRALDILLEAVDSDSTGGIVSVPPRKRR